MDLTNYHHSERIERVSWEYRYDHLGHLNSWGYAFPCSDTGVVYPLEGAAIESLVYCQTHPEEFEPAHIHKFVWIQNHPAQGVCECGRLVICYDPLWNSCDCGRYYNLSGQEVEAPRMGGYRYETGETYSDIVNGRDEDY